MYQVPFDYAQLSYPEALGALKSALRFGIEPMLESVEDMLAVLDYPDKHFSAIQIAGTNGKTSTSRYCTQILLEHGFNCGLYTSPELVEYTERMEIGGKVVTKEQFADGISAALGAGELVNNDRQNKGLSEYSITEFDLLTVAACVVFAKAGLDWVILEVGLGGRWDATSAISSIKHVAITGIGLDHTHILGDTLEEIAGEKAAIIKPSRSCTLGVGTMAPKTVEQVFLDAAKAADVIPTLVRPHDMTDAKGEVEAGQSETQTKFPVSQFEVIRHPNRLGAPLEFNVHTSLANYFELACLKPSYQAANIALAISVCEHVMGQALNPETLYNAIIKCPTPGRFSLLRAEPPILVDACHNVQSVRSFLASFEEIVPYMDERPCLLLAILKDKDASGMIDELVPHFPKIVCTQTDSPRALSAHELAKLVEERGHAVEGVYSSVNDAVHAIYGDSFVALGSITLAGAIYRLLR